MYLQNKRVENQFFRTTVPNVSNRMRFKKIIFFVENQTLSIVISFVSNCIYCGKIKTLVVNIKSIVFAVVKYTLWPWEISFDKQHFVFILRSLYEYSSTNLKSVLDASTSVTNQMNKRCVCSVLIRCQMYNLLKFKL